MNKSSSSLVGCVWGESCTETPTALWVLMGLGWPKRFVDWDNKSVVCFLACWGGGGGLQVVTQRNANCWPNCGRGSWRSSVSGDNCFFLLPWLYFMLFLLALITVKGLKVATVFMANQWLALQSPTFAFYWNIGTERWPQGRCPSLVLKLFSGGNKTKVLNHSNWRPSFLVLVYIAERTATFGMKVVK